MNVGIFGAGKLGMAVAKYAERDGEMKVAWIADIGEIPAAHVDVVLDATTASAVPGRIDWAREKGVDLVIATTGWDRSILERAGKLDIGILTAPNFSLGVAFMRRAALALGKFAALDAGADLSVLERHHRAKLDAPSGTGISLALAMAEGCPRYSGWTSEPRGGKGIPVASVRAGTEIGYHELRLEADAEAIVFAHEAKSRDLFVPGIIRSMKWIHGKKGTFTFDDLASELIDPLFVGGTGRNPKGDRT